MAYGPFALLTLWQMVNGSLPLVALNQNAKDWHTM
jgi:hypothetical protein